MSKLLKHTFCFGLAALCMAGCSDDDANVTDAMGSHDVDKMEKPARNPYLAQETYSITHFNSAQTDAFAYAVKDVSTTWTCRNAHRPGAGLST